MKRSTFDETKDQKPRGGVFDGYLSCQDCKSATPIATLGQYGRRCRPCYDAYCAEGSSGGRDGYLQGAPDTADQRDMRKRLRENRPVGQTMARDVVLENVPVAQAATDQRVREYARRMGLSLADSATLLAGGRDRTAEKAGEHAR
jgi:hypothetical protein